MTRSALTAALFALLGTALVAPPAAAADLPAILRASVDIPDDEGADDISGLQAVTITDLAPEALSVKVTLAGVELPPLPAVGGSATGTIETWGFAGNNRNLVLAQCVDAEATDCGATLTISTKIDNPLPTHELTPTGTEFSEDFDLTPHLQVASGAPRLRLTLDGGTSQFVDPDETTSVDVDALAATNHVIAIGACAADESPCAPGETVSFTVVKTVPGSFSIPAPAFSPNADGQFDNVAFNYTQQVGWDAASVEVLNAADVVVFDSAVPLPVAPSNDGTFLYDGKDELGAVLPDGAYTARLTASRTLDSGDTVSSTYAAQPFTVDNTALAPVSLTPTFATIYPYDDAYRVSTKLNYTGREPYSAVDFVVRNAANDVVRTKQILAPADAVWNGRDDAGVRVPAGHYTVRIRVYDAVHNLGFSPAAEVAVSAKKVVTVTKAITVTPAASRIDGQTGSCSTRRTPSAHGWAGSTGYLSNTRCRNGFNASIVWTLNRVKLASAVKYYWVRLGWFGGPTRAATHDRAIATLYGTDSSAQGWFSSLDYLAGQYIPQLAGSKVVKAGYVSWGFQADRGNRYDVKSFTITYKADVLR